MEVNESEAVVTNEQQPAAVEQPVQTEQTDKPKELLSTQFAALAKKEKAALQRQREAEAKLKEAEEKLKLFEQFESKKKTAKANPLEFLSEAGLTYDEITDYMLNGGVKQKDKTELLEEKFNEFVSRKEKEEQDRIEKEKKALELQQEKLVQEYVASINKYVDENKDKFELINLYNAQELIIATIEAHYENKQEVLSKERAAELVEAHLEDEVKKLANSKKFAEKFKGNAEEKQQAQAKNSMTLSSSQPTSNVPSMLSAKTEEDRLKRALAALG